MWLTGEQVLGHVTLLGWGPERAVHPLHGQDGVGTTTFPKSSRAYGPPMTDWGAPPRARRRLRARHGPDRLTSLAREVPATPAWDRARRDRPPGRRTVRRRHRPDGRAPGGVDGAARRGAAWAARPGPGSRRCSRTRTRSPSRWPTTPPAIVWGHRGAPRRPPRGPAWLARVAAVLAGVAPMRFGTAGVPRDVDPYELFRALPRLAHPDAGVGASRRRPSSSTRLHLRAPRRRPADARPEARLCSSAPAQRVSREYPAQAPPTHPGRVPPCRPLVRVRAGPGRRRAVLTCWGAPLGGRAGPRSDDRGAPSSGSEGRQGPAQEPRAVRGPQDAGVPGRRRPTSRSLGSCPGAWLGPEYYPTNTVRDVVRGTLRKRSARTRHRSSLSTASRIGTAGCTSRRASWRGRVQGGSSRSRRVRPGRARPGARRDPVLRRSPAPERR